MSVRWHGSIKCIPLAHEGGMEGIVWVESVATSRFLVPSHTVTHG